MNKSLPWWFYFLVFFAGAFSLVLQASALSGYLPFGGDLFSVLGSFALLLGLFCTRLPQSLMQSLILVLGYFSPLVLRNFIKGTEHFAFFQSLLTSASATLAIVLSGSLFGFALGFLLRKFHKRWGSLLKGRTSYRP